MLKKFIKRSAVVGFGGLVTYKFIIDEQSKRDAQGIFNGFFNSFRAAYIVGSSIYAYQTGFGDLVYNTDEYITRREEIHTEVAKKILELSLVNRGIYLKAGQYLGNLERIMPKEYTDVLKVLQDSGPSLSFEEIKVVLEKDIGKIDDVFSEFDKEAIAAASLAQVHRAKLKKNGQEVAVKIQFPFLRTQTHYDLTVISQIVKLCDWFLQKSPDFKDIKMHVQFSNFQKVLLEELNFYNERSNADLTREQFKNYDQLYIPQYFHDYMSQRVLTMEFVRGVKINDKKGIENMKLKPLECANILIDIMGRMLFKTAHVHADPHPGNIFVRQHPNDPKKPQIVLIDHGFYVDVPPQIQKDFCELWYSLVTFNYTRMKKIAESLGIGQHYRYLPVIFLFRTMESKTKLGSGMGKEDKKILYQQNLISFEKISLLVQDLPPEMIFMIRANNIIAIHNSTLGGTTRDRAVKFTNFVVSVLNPSFIGYYSRLAWVYFKLMMFEKFHSLFKIMFKSYSREV
ncbi:hypothetical protein ABPG72_020794 [Tetrahymena utriculariae]